MDNYTIVRIFLIVLAVATLIVLIQKYNSSQTFVDSEGFYADDEFQRMQEELLPLMSRQAPVSQPQPTQSARKSVLPQPQPEPTAPPFYSNPTSDEDYKAVSFNEDGAASDGPRFPEDNDSQRLPAECFPKDKLTAEDLLPKDAANSKWSQVNPAGQGSVKDQNFLQAGYHVGLNTTQGTMKNANLQLRSDPVAPKSLVSPWLNSSYEPDVMRKPLEIGEAC